MASVRAKVKKITALPDRVKWPMDARIKRAQPGTARLGQVLRWEARRESSPRSTATSASAPRFRTAGSAVERGRRWGQVHTCLVQRRRAALPYRDGPCGSAATVVNIVGEPCEGPHARFDEGRQERSERLNQSPTLRNRGPVRLRRTPGLIRGLSPRAPWRS